VSSITLNSYHFDFKYTGYKIDSNHHELVIKINDEDKIIGIEEDEYTVREIIDVLQSAFDQEKIEININLVDDHIEFISKSNDNFTLVVTDKSVLPLFGFTSHEYSNNSEYMSEERHRFNNLIDIYLSNIDQNNPIFTIDLLKKTKNMKYVINSNKVNISDIIIQMKQTDGQLYDFNEQPHELTLNFEYQEKYAKSVTKSD
jgi:hypothetical protein